ncbi:MAG: hypothetical protein SGARI_002227, partial [Bacillariaceae sp.]
MGPTESFKKLCIYSKVAKDVKIGGKEPSAGSGHAAILLWDNTKDPATVTTWGAWPDKAAVDNGPGKDIRKNYVKDAYNKEVYPYIYCEEISEDECKKLEELVAKDFTWKCEDNCASFAEDTFSAVTGTKIDAVEVTRIGEVETPRIIGKSIRAKNNGKNTGPDGC